MIDTKITNGTGRSIVAVRLHRERRLTEKLNPNEVHERNEFTNTNLVNREQNERELTIG